MKRSIEKMRMFALRKADLGWSRNAIARELQINRSTVGRWLKKYQNCNKQAISNKPTRIKMPGSRNTILLPT